MVVATARNGTEFGLQTSGTGDAWFRAPAPQVEGLYLSGFGPGDANPDIGDSTITETVGIGGMAMAAALRSCALGVGTRRKPCGVLAVNTGIAGREPGVGQFGAGLVTPPMSVFTDTVRALAARAG